MMLPINNIEGGVPTKHHSNKGSRSPKKDISYSN